MVWAIRFSIVGAPLAVAAIKLKRAKENLYMARNEWQFLTG